MNTPAMPQRRPPALRQRLSQPLWVGLAMLAGLHECVALARARLRRPRRLS